MEDSATTCSSQPCSCLCGQPPDSVHGNWRNWKGRRGIKLKDSGSKSEASGQGPCPTSPPEGDLVGEPCPLLRGGDLLTCRRGHEGVLCWAQEQRARVGHQGGGPESVEISAPCSSSYSNLSPQIHLIFQLAEFQGSRKWGNPSCPASCTHHFPSYTILFWTFPILPPRSSPSQTLAL